MACGEASIPQPNRARKAEPAATAATAATAAVWNSFARSVARKKKYFDSLRWTSDSALLHSFAYQLGP